MMTKWMVPIAFASIVISGLYLCSFDTTLLHRTATTLASIPFVLSTDRSRNAHRPSTDTVDDDSRQKDRDTTMAIATSNTTPIHTTAILLHAPGERHPQQQHDNSNDNRRRNDQDVQTVFVTAEHYRRNTADANQNQTAAAAAAYEYVMRRKDAYEQLGLSSRWKMRGVGYLYHYWNIILLATLPPPQSLWQSGRKVVTIRNIMNEPKNDDNIDNMTTSTGTHSLPPPPLFPTSPYIEANGVPYINCSLWTIYVRVNGPEIFAGSADAVFVDSTAAWRNDCYWEFPFHLQKPGTYVVDVKIVCYNASSIMESPCTIHQGTVDVATLAKRTSHRDNDTTGTSGTPTGLTATGFKGFKMYSPAEMCCEICSRLYHDCQYWATPPLQFINETHEPPSRMNNGCDLFYPTDDNSKASGGWSTTVSMFVNHSRASQPPSQEQQEQQQQQQRPNRQRMLRGSVADYHGPPNGERHTYFVGCGWSFWMTLDFPCISGDLDDRIYVANHENTFTFVPTTTRNDGNRDRTTMDDDAGIVGTETMLDTGTTIPTLTTNTGTDSTLLPLCTLDMEQPHQHVGRWVRYPWPNATICPHEMEKDPDHSERFVIMKYDPDHPPCYFRDDLSIVGHTCMEMNCRFIPAASQWKTSSLHLEQQWYGYYEPYRCRYHLEYTDEQLQTCIDERKIYKIDGSGQSIWHFLRQYLYQRIRPLKLYDNQAMDGLEIHLSSLQLTHEPMNTLRDKLMKERPILDPSRTEFYWVNSVYMSSEREQEARGAVQLIKSAIAQDVLGPKNYYMLNLYDMTKAFTYDTATQMDGFHIIGPPMKMLISKLFHYMCYNTSVSPRQ